MAKRLRGTVSSNKMDKTVVVKVERVKEHPLYRKKYTVSTNFKAHDADNSCNIGDVVEMVESRPLSRDKRWVVERVVQTADLVGVPAAEVAELEVVEVTKQAEKPAKTDKADKVEAAEAAS